MKPTCDESKQLEAQGTEETGTDRPAAPFLGPLDARSLELVIEAAHAQRLYSRKEFEAWPLELVLLPCLTAPVLVHARPALFTDVDGSATDAYALIAEMRSAWPRAKLSPERAQRFALQLRRVWRQVVRQADGYTWPDAPQALYCFEGE